jgi:hypothetical protein
MVRDLKFTSGRRPNGFTLPLCRISRSVQHSIFPYRHSKYLHMQWGTDLADRLLSHTGMRVAIIEDQLNVRESLRILIDGTTGLRSAGTYRSMEEALQGVALEIPDVILVDLKRHSDRSV